MILFGLFISEAYSWWGHSHMVIAKIASTYLTKQETKKIEKLINYGTLETSNIVSSATWQDDLKDQGKFYGMGNWHFVDTPVILPNTNISKIHIAPDTYNITTYLTDAMDCLLNPTTADPWVFAYHLRSIIHFVGDIHTPHHTCQMYCDDIPNGDLGGNKYYLNCQFGSACNNIHFLWDSAGLTYPIFNPLIPLYIDEFNQNVTEIMEKFPEDYFSDKKFDLHAFKPYSWANESNKIANEIGYATPINKRPSDEYFSQVQNKSQERIALAGIRLGYLLKDLLNKVDFQIDTPPAVTVREIVVWVIDALLLIGTIILTILVNKKRAYSVMAIQ
ncbi:class I nuclease [Tritrichomonas foetus]|uniref:Class I nuclease n=1 Tax=Tritrichomonas foetus TaxID=1144522 RepID=A0A1J4L3R3_9EUKA|nr:class I nuclease [Tritrichomonas foetus]|eukprot:OHT17704.1 class I nuclease [Tritrichomonas foetus]